jgi:malate synthase
VGYQGEAANPSSVLLQHNGLHLDIRINRKTPIGANDPAGVSDLVLEAALSTILDLEDSVAVVDAQDKVLAYSNWLGILKGTLTEDVSKGGTTFKRGLNPDRVYTAPKWRRSEAARPLADVRAQRGPPDDQPGHPVHGGRRQREAKSPRASWTRWSPPPLRCTTCRAMAQDGIRNSRTGSVYIVKPKMHGPAEVAFAASCSPAWRRCWA